jgi:hypothetical protein
VEAGRERLDTLLAFAFSTIRGGGGADRRIARAFIAAAESGQSPAHRGGGHRARSRRVLTG